MSKNNINRPNQWSEGRGGHNPSISSNRTISTNPQSDSIYPRYPNVSGGVRGRGGGPDLSFNNRNFSAPVTANEVLSNYYD